MKNEKIYLKGTPKITVIMPVRNEAAYISNCLRAVFEQDYPHNHMEVFVIDGMSTDRTREISRKLSAQYPDIAFWLLDNSRGIVSTGLNLAIPKAQGNVIVRVDGHTIIAPDYIRQCVTALEHTGADNVGGRMNAVGTTKFGETVALATSTPFGIGGGRFHYSNKEEWVDTVYMGAWPLRVFEKIGLFDEELVRDQDDEFNYRLRASGGKILLSPKIISEYTVRSTPGTLWNQYFQYGFWKVRVLQKHPRQMRLRQFVPPLFVLALFISILFAFHPISSLISAVIPIIYLIANFIVSIHIARDQGWKFLPHLPLIYAILHLSYGLGFLVGLFIFSNRWNDKLGKTPKLPHETN